MTPRGEPGTVALMLPLLAEMDVRALLPTVRVPTLVLHHTDDPMIPPEWGKDVTNRIPGAKYVELPGRNVSHFYEPPSRLTWPTIGFSPRCFSPTSWTRRAARRRSATVTGTRLTGGRLSRRSLSSSPAVSRRVHLAPPKASELRSHHGVVRVEQASSRCSTARSGRSAARWRSATRCRALGIEVRAGFHTGECEVRGDDIGGIGVHIGARVSALAGPNDVLVSSTLRDPRTLDMESVSGR